MQRFLKRLWSEEKGQDLVEYGLLLVLISLVAVTAMKTLANGINTAYKTASNQLTS